MKRLPKARGLTTTLLSLSVLASCAAQAQPAAAVPPSPGLEARAALGDETTAILRGATHVQVFRLLTWSQRARQQTLAQFGGHVSGPVSQGAFSDDRMIVSAGPDQGRTFVALADRALLDNELFDPGGLGKCFDPGVGLRFWKGRQRVDVALCFECAQLSVTTYDAVGRRIHEIPQLAMGFDQPLFVQLVRSAFRRDTEIDAIKPLTLPDDIVTPEARASQEDDVREAIFRHLMKGTGQAPPRGPARTVYFLSIGRTDQIPTDPDRALLRRFADGTSAVRAVSARRPGEAPRAAVFLRAAHLWWIEPTTVYAEASYGTASGARASTYGLTKSGGRWVITHESLGWGS